MPAIIQSGLDVHKKSKIESDLSCAVSCVEGIQVLFRRLKVFSISETR